VQAVPSSDVIGSPTSNICAVESVVRDAKIALCADWTWFGWTLCR
jgi:hypothetical protein